MSAKSEEAIFSAAIQLEDRAQRQAYVTRACGKDTALQVSVEALLRAHESQCLLDVPAVARDDLQTDTQPSEGPGAVIGSYKLLEKIGEGGMAVVYMAQQQEPIRRKVALKIIKLGMDTKQVIARFEAERQVLAMMDHANIARVFDAGATETGRPYFVMELVKGLSITEYCDQNSLGTKDRLRLFIETCHAVQHAHQKGIIHRDIKPSNVMVTMHNGTPVPKVIDFGIAKATNRRLTEKTLFTRYAQIIGTPAYMSPEQAEFGDSDTDTRTDVYSLGVLLYELLTGTTPFSEEKLREAGYLEMQRVIREEEPTKPSTKLSTLGDGLTDVAKQRSCSPDLLRRTLRGDLDWIVMMALEKDRTRRYESSNQLLGDVERHLNHEPVLAGPPGIWYQTKKFVQRHRAFVAATSAIVIAVVVGLIVSVTMYVRAERARAETQAVTDFLTNDLLTAVYPENAKKPEVTVRYILETASAKLEGKFASSPLVEAEIRATLGLTYQKLGDYVTAEPQLARVLEIYLGQLGADDPATLTALNNLGWLYWHQGRYDEAEPVLVEAVEQRTRILGEAHPDTLQSMSNLGWLYGMRRVEGRIGQAMELHTKVLEIGEHVLGEEHPVMLQSMCDLALEYATVRRLDEAETLGTKGLEISRRVLGNEHESTLYHMNTLAWIYGHQRRYDEALALAREALDTSGRVVGEEHLASIWARSIVGWIYLEQARYDDATAPLTESVEISERVFGHGHALTQFFRSRIIGLYEQQERYAELDELLVRAYEVGRQVHGEAHLHTRLFRQRLIARLPELGLLGKDQYENQQYENALATFTHVDEIRRVLGLQSVPFELAPVAMSLHQLGDEYKAQAALNHLRRLCTTGDYAYDEGLFYEAEQFLAGDNRSLSKAWGAMRTGQLHDARAILARLRGDNRDAVSYPLDDVESLAKALARGYCVRAEEAESRRVYHQAFDFYEAALQADPSDERLLNRFAWLLATSPLEDVRDGRRAVQLARKACELTAWKSAGCVNTLAAAEAEARDYGKAVTWQKTAMDLLAADGRGARQADYEKRLHLYEADNPYHQEDTLPMLAWWTFDRAADGHVMDVSGNGFDGTLVGDAKIIVDPERGNVLRLEGEGYVDCGNDVAFDITGPITIAAWIKVHVFDAGHQAVVTKGDSAWMLDRNYGYDSIRLVCSGCTVLGHGWGRLPGRRSVNDVRWHHVVGVYDRTTMYLYIDGELDASTMAYGKTSINNMPVFIGANSEQPGREWKGLIDDVRIYDYAFTEAEIEAVYSGEEIETVEN